MDNYFKDKIGNRCQLKDKPISQNNIPIEYSEPTSVSEKNENVFLAIQRVVQLGFSDFKILNAETYKALQKIGVTNLLQLLNEKAEQGQIQKEIEHIKQEIKNGLSAIEEFDQLVAMTGTVLTGYANAKSVDFSEANFQEDLKKMWQLGKVLHVEVIKDFLFKHKEILDNYEIANSFSTTIELANIIKEIRNKIPNIASDDQSKNKDYLEDESRAMSSVKRATIYSYYQGLHDLMANDLLDAKENLQFTKDIQLLLLNKNPEELMKTIICQIEVKLKEPQPDYNEIIILFNEAIKIFWPEYPGDLNMESYKKILRLLEIFLSPDLTQNIEFEIEDITLISLQNLALDAFLQFSERFQAFQEKTFVEPHCENVINQFKQKIKNRVDEYQEKNGLIKKLAKEIDKKKKLISDKKILESDDNDSASNTEQEVFEMENRLKSLKQNNEEDVTIFLQLASQLGALNHSIQRFYCSIDQTESSIDSIQKKAIENYNHPNWIQEVERLVIKSSSDCSWRMQKLIFNTVGEIIDTKDPTTFKHSKYVAERLFKVFLEHARITKMPAEEIVKQGRKIYISGLLHDLGKLFSATKALNKPGKLTNEEFQKEIIAHSELGYYYGLQLGFEEDITITALDHHERYDGEGYPSKKAKNEISFNGKMAAITDSMNAATQSRRYESPMEFSMQLAKVIFESKCYSGSQFDPYAVELYLKSIGFEEFANREITPEILETYKAVNEKLHKISEKLPKLISKIQEACQKINFKINQNAIEPREVLDILKEKVATLSPNENITQELNGLIESGEDMLKNTNVLIEKKKSWWQKIGAKAKIYPQEIANQNSPICSELENKLNVYFEEVREMQVPRNS